jgi:hypothetical protein
MLEKRRFPRLNVKLPVKLRIFDPEAKTDVTNDIEVYTKDISGGGLCLILPRGWECQECNNCLGWIYNLDCKLKNNHATETNRILPAELDLKITVSYPSNLDKEPAQLEGRCAWVNADIGPEENAYPVGVELSKTSQKKISEYLSEIFSP